MDEPADFTNEGEALRGVLGRPDGEDRGAGVVLLHGWGSCRLGPHRILVQTARELNARGFWTLRFDHRGRGESEGRSEDVNLDGMISDACRAVECLRDRAGCGRVALLGICSGGNVAIGAATLLEEVPALVVWSTLPFQTHHTRGQDLRRTGFFLAEYARKAVRLETWRRFFKGRISLGGVANVLFGHYAKEEGPEKANPKDSERDIMAALRQYRGRVLFTYGGRDPESVEAKGVYEPFCSESGIRAEFQVVEGSNHNFYGREWKRQVIERSASFLEECMPKSR